MGDTVQQQQAQAALEMIRAIYDDGEAEINGRTYAFTKMLHKQRRTVFAFYSSVRTQLQVQDFSFLDGEPFGRVEDIMSNCVLVDGSALSRLPDHWDEHPDDYLAFVGTALAVISYPFLAAAHPG